MTTYIVLFRGINVGGNKLVKMETLRKALVDAGFGDVQTYIQSANVVQTSELTEPQLAASIERLFAATFGFPSRPTIRSQAAWRELVANTPYGHVSEGRQVHAVLLDEAPTSGAVDALRALATTEEMELRDGVLYLHTPDGFGRSKVPEQLDRVLKVPLTARNWNTVLRLLAMAESAEG